MSHRTGKPPISVIAGFVCLGLITSKLLYAYTGNPVLSLLTGIVAGTVAGVLPLWGKQSEPAE
jgi:hypothetical protein